MVHFTEIDGSWTERIAARRGEMIVSRGQAHRVRQLPGYVAEEIGDIAGLVLYRMADTECEIVALNSYCENQGIGTRLIDLVRQKAIAESCRRLWLITTNDNIRAIRFYQLCGFDMKHLHYDAVEQARKIKPSIPLRSAEGIPIRHEIEFEIRFE